ncbi:MAG: hypothetical protein HOU81_00980 [Hamadaea sp.]|uniref:hypothetical protein n=1 Tax=Hamadaea sp. TaxID=2024425 RepID=UPI0017A4C972|nr:hypothetical protein [Hamadaea sp.]NUR69371.1 hypothetical protein [Hamadaea sp.]NUT23188.1 hypothetical protein [Hamadaea sp.]
MRVHLRPNAAYLAFLLLGLVAAGWGVAKFLGGQDIQRFIGLVIAVGGAMIFLAFGYPVVASTLLRVPVLAVEEERVRLPLMGPTLAKAEIAGIGRSHTATASQRPVLLIRVTDPESVISRTRPWLRRSARQYLQQYGTPIILQGESLNRSLDEIAEVLRSHFIGV